MTAVAVSAASRLREARWKHKGALDEPRAKEDCRDFRCNLRDATGREPKRAADSTTRGGNWELVGAIVAQNRPSRSRESDGGGGECHWSG
jgi:hypothetical protein